MFSTGANTAERAPPQFGPYLLEPAPLVEALASRKPAVKNGHLISKSPCEDLNNLGRESDLRYKDDGGAAGLQCLSDSIKIDLGLAAGGHAEQERRSGLARGLSIPRANRFSLAGRERRRGCQARWRCGGRAVWEFRERQRPPYQPGSSALRMKPGPQLIDVPEVPGFLQTSQTLQRFEDASARGLGRPDRVSTALPST